MRKGEKGERGERNTFLVRDIVGDGEEVDVAEGNAHVLCLAAGKAPREMRISKNTSCAPAVHGLGHGVRVGHLALRRQFLLAEEALPTSNLKTSHISAPDLHPLHALPHTLHNSTELMPQNIPLLHLHHGPVQQMQVAPAHGRARDLENDVPVLDDLGLGHVDHFDFLLALPDERFHGLARRDVLVGAGVGGDILLDVFGVVADGFFEGVGALDGHFGGL